MKKLKIAFFLDSIEFKYFAFNQLVTSFWLIMECNRRGWEVFIGVPSNMYLTNENPSAQLYKTHLKSEGGTYVLTKDEKCSDFSLNDFDMVFFRPDPPININYIHYTYILDYINREKVLVVNDSFGIRNANEKLYIYNFPDLIPPSLTTTNAKLIKEFISQYGEVIIKPLDKCFGKGVFYVKEGDKNINSIIEAATNIGTSNVMVQKYLKASQGGDKRVNIICGNLLEEGIIKISGDGDFKFNAQKDECFKKGDLTDEEREVCNKIIPILNKEGLYLVGLDIINGKIIEINVTSPCFFIKEINQFYKTKLEVKILDELESLYYTKINQKCLV